MPPEALSLSIADARRLQRRAVLLDAPLRSVDAVLSHLGYVQIDPINVCGRMHDHILRPRVADYREGDLTRHLHGDDTRHAPAARSAFEHHLPDTHVLVAFPQDAWPHLLAAMRRRTRHRGPWSGRLTSQERALSDTILAELGSFLGSR